MKRRALRVAGGLLILALGSSSDQAMAVVKGKTVPIVAAPWSVLVVSEHATCTGVIINAHQVLTAEHCVMYGETAKPEPASDFTIEAGVSDFRHPRNTDHPQTRVVSAERLMPGYIPSDRLTARNSLTGAAHDLAVLTLSRPLDLHGADVSAAALPTHTREPSFRTRVVMAGFGEERDGSLPNGTLNEISQQTVVWCGTSRVVCAFSALGTCWGDSGAGLVEPGANPTVLGVLSQNEPNCDPGPQHYVGLDSPATLRFIMKGN